MLELLRLIYNENYDEDCTSLCRTYLFACKVMWFIFYLYCLMSIQDVILILMTLKYLRIPSVILINAKLLEALCRILRQKRVNGSL